VVLFSLLFSIPKIFPEPPHFITSKILPIDPDYETEDNEEKPIPSNIPFVDSHIHIWDVPNTPRKVSSLLSVGNILGLSEKWRRILARLLFPTSSIEFFGTDIYLIKDHLPDDIRRETQGLKLSKVVHIEAGWEGNHVDETAWLQKMADGDKDGIPHGIVGTIEFEESSEKVDEILKGHSKYKNFRGIRQSLAKGTVPEVMDFAHTDYTKIKTWTDNYALLGKYNLSFEAWMFHHQLKSFAEIGCQHPEIPVVLDHFGTPQIYPKVLGKNAYQELISTEDGKEWQEGIEILSKCQNIFIKLDGFGMPVNGFGFHRKNARATVDEIVEVIQPFFEYLIRVFGVDRCLFASNFPVDKVSFTYNNWFHAFLKAMNNLNISQEDQNKILYQNAVRFYRL